MKRPGLGLIIALLGTAAPLEASPAVQPGTREPAIEQDSEYGCLVCHAEKRRTFTMGVHSERGIHCDDCHGGDPSSVEIAAAHRGRFLGDPTKLQTIELCSSCHSDASRMRQYGLDSGQLAEFRTSRHGQLLLGRGDLNAPTCTDCHDAHLILPPDDARSNVHPTNIPATCAGCHEDEQLMGRYGLPTNQFHDYRTSAHGIAVFEAANFAAPTCTGCHGSHAALPPGVTEVVNVCDHCHVLIGRALHQGPHAASAVNGDFPGCLACHSNHGTERIEPAGIAAVCTNCHEAGSRAAAVGVVIQEETVQAAAELAAAEQAIAELRLSGRQVSNEVFRLESALTSYRQMAVAQHSFDLAMMEDLSRGVRTNTSLVRATAEARAEQQWEHKLLLVPVWFLAFSTVVLVWFKFRDLRHQGRA